MRYLEIIESSTCTIVKSSILVPKVNLGQLLVSYALTCDLWELRRHATIILEYIGLAVVYGP